MATVPYKNPDKLTPDTRQLMFAFLAECKKQRLNIDITETWRSPERQKELKSKGSSKKTRSKHQDGLAFDIHNDGKEGLYDDAVMRKCGEIGKKLGLFWGGDFKGFYDSCHFQNDNKAGTIKGDDEVIEKKKMKINGSLREVNTIVKDGSNYIKLQDLADWKISVEFDTINKYPIIDARA